MIGPKEQLALDAALDAFALARADEAVAEYEAETGLSEQGEVNAKRRASDDARAAYERLRHVLIRRAIRRAVRKVQENQ